MGFVPLSNDVHAVTASYFDVDGTLVRTNLMHTALYYMSNQINPLRSAQSLGRLLLRAPALAPPPWDGELRRQWLPRPG